MKSKNKKLLIAKLIILILCVIIVARIFALVLSRYESNTNSNANVDIAFYLLNEDYKQMTLNLGTILPKNEKYVYTFSIGNEEGSKVAEVDLRYNLKIRTTTNLPLTYELYRNQDYDNPNSSNIIRTNEVTKDEDGTSFRNIGIDEALLRYKEPQTDIYYLVVNFPENYDEKTYQDIIEMIEISVDAKQVIN